LAWSGLSLDSGSECNMSFSLLLAVQLAVFATASISTYSQWICATRLTTKKPASVPASSTTATILATTSTVFAPVASFYAACNADNIVSTINGNVVAGVRAANGVSNSFYFLQRVVTAYDCCVACIQSDTCGAALFYDTYTNIPLKQCFQIGNGGTCSGSTLVTELVADGNSPAAFIASNGLCGQFSYP
jgi:hypothetical protein